MPGLRILADETHPVKVSIGAQRACVVGFRPVRRRKQCRILLCGLPRSRARS